MAAIVGVVGYLLYSKAQDALSNTYSIQQFQNEWEQGMNQYDQEQQTPVPVPFTS
jgi:hypothetical protein